jgi:hypothetical protein
VDGSSVLKTESEGMKFINNSSQYLKSYVFQIGKREIWIFSRPDFPEEDIEPDLEISFLRGKSIRLHFRKKLYSLSVH